MSEVWIIWVAAWLQRSRIDQCGEFWEVNVAFGKIQPRGTVWTSEPIFLGTTEPFDVVFDGRLFGDDFDPVPIQFTVHSVPESRRLTEEILERARAAAGPEEVE
jgi:hypothetical protein